MFQSQSSLSPQNRFSQEVGAVALKEQSSDQATGTSLSFLHQLLGDYHPRNFTVKNSRLLPPVGVWTVSQFQCGWSSSQTSYPS